MEKGQCKAVSEDPPYAKAYIGVEKVIIPKDNYADLWEIDEVVKNNVEFIPVSSIDEVLAIAVVGDVEEKASLIFSHHDVIIKDRRKNSEIR